MLVGSARYLSYYATMLVKPSYYAHNNYYAHHKLDQQQHTCMCGQYSHHEVNVVSTVNVVHTGIIH